MGRELSKLQKEILLLAYRQKGVCLVRDVLTKVYQFPTKGNIQEAKPGAPIFERKEIGLKRYQAASVAIVKSFNRLIRRALASKQYYGINLTPNGTKLAETIISKQEVK